MNNFIAYKDEIIRLCNDVENLATVFDITDIRPILDNCREHLDKLRLCVVVCGDNGRGKSSLLRTYLRETDLSVLSKEHTNKFVTMFCYGEEEEIQVFYDKEDTKIKRSFVHKVKREELESYMEQLESDSHITIRFLHIQTPNQSLKNGLVFVDTPGIHSFYGCMNELTYGYLHYADLMLFVGDILTPFNDEEMKFLCSAYKQCDNVIFPLTKTEQLQHSKGVPMNNRKRIKEATPIAYRSIKIVPVACPKRVSKLHKKSPSRQHSRLEKEIWDSLYKKRTEENLLPVAYRIIEQVDQMTRCLKRNLEFIAAPIEVQQQMQQQMKKRFNYERKHTELAKEAQSMISEKFSELNERVLKLVEEKEKELKNEVLTFQKECNARKLSRENRISELARLEYNLHDEIATTILNAKSIIVEEIAVIETEARKELLFDKEEEGKEIEEAAASKDPLMSRCSQIAIKNFGCGSLAFHCNQVINETIQMILGGPSKMIDSSIQLAGNCGYIGKSSISIHGMLLNYKNDLIDDEQLYQGLFKYLEKKKEEVMESISLSLKEAHIYLLNDYSAMMKRHIRHLEYCLSDFKQTLQMDENARKNKKQVIEDTFGKLEEFKKRGSDLLSEGIRS
ncbi:MAG: hypothetical protein E7256_16220 [Lachnospiraceae bacterium]|nr:hypothetical protein [Lachnospiraceae bacterium]